MTSPDLSHYDIFVEQATTWQLHSQEHLPSVPQTARIEWQRDGLRAVWERIETLKMAAAQLNQVGEDAARMVGAAKASLVELRALHDDQSGPTLANTVSTQVARGMAADERRIDRDTKAMPITIRRRRIERLLELLEAHQRAVNQRLYGIRDERLDLRAQLRAIDLGLEIGEL